MSKELCLISIDKSFHMWKYSFLIGISFLHYSASQFVAPLRFDTAIDRLRQFRHANWVDFIENAPIFNQPVDHLRSFSASNATTQCQQDVKLLLESVERKQLWALKVIDAWGKPLPSGILKGNTFWVGNYDECVGELYQMNTKSYLAQPMSTQHCTITPAASNTSSLLSITLGICVPSSCNRSAIVQLIDSVFISLNLTEKNIVCSNDSPNGQDGLTLGATIVILVLSILTLVVLFGTLVDLVVLYQYREMNQNHGEINTEIKSNYPRFTSDVNSDPQVWLEFLSEFSALRTLRRIFTMTEKRNTDTFKFINGIRVVSLFWVIIGHSIAFSLSYTSNAIDVLSWTRNFFFQLVTNAVFSVDTFFVLSGFLTAILFVRQVEKRRSFSFRMMILYYIHRYIRLTPAFFLMVLVSINLTPYFGYGPFYPRQQGFETPQCRSQYWWTSLVYVGNLVHSNYACLPVTWYLHNDMQFHWIAPLTLVPFVLKRKALAIFLAITLALTSVVSIASITTYYSDMALSTLGEFGAAVSIISFLLSRSKPHYTSVLGWCQFL